MVQDELEYDPWRVYGIANGMFSTSSIRGKALPRDDSAKQAKALGIFG